MKCPLSSRTARDLRWPRLRELAQRPPNRVHLKWCPKAVPSERPYFSTGASHRLRSRWIWERRDRTVPRGAIACSPPCRCYAGIEAGQEIGSKTGYEYLAPNLTTRQFSGPNTKLRTSVFRKDGWALRLITSTCNGRERYRMKEHWLVASAVHAAAPVRRPHGISA